MGIKERLRNLNRIVWMINESGFSVDEARDALEALKSHTQNMIHQATTFGIITVDEAATFRKQYCL